MPVVAPQVQANGLSFEVETFGNPKHPALLLIMGLGCQMVAWPDELCTSLAAAGFHVIRFDNRDIGLSSKMKQFGKPELLKNALRSQLGLRVQAPYRLDDMARDAIGILDALNIRKAHVVGASMGGMIAQLMALDHPDRVASLTSIMSSSGNPRLPQPTLQLRLRLIQRPRGQDRESLIDHGIRTWQLMASPKAVPPREELRTQVIRSLDRAIYPKGYARQLLAVLGSGSRHRRLPQIRVSTLVIHGQDDPLVPVAAGHEQQRLIPGARLELLDGMGHNLPSPLLPRISALISTHAKAATG